MNLQLIVEEKRGFLTLRKLFRHCDHVEILQNESEANQWYYFRRTHPVKIEVYTEEDFQYNHQVTSVESALNASDPFSQVIDTNANDLLCLDLESGWQEFVRFEGQWIQKPANEYITWRHFLVAKGRVESGCQPQISM